jgi:hypothetical protein
MKTIEQFLEGPVSNAFIQEFFEQEAVAKKQVKAAQANIDAFEENLPREE